MPLFSVYLTCTGYAGVPVVWGGLLLELYGRTNSHVQEDTQFAHTPTSSRGACQLIPAPSHEESLPLLPLPPGNAVAG